jgi:CheY-like chemotaxis protein
LTVETAPEPLWAWTDPNLLQNALLNLLINARDAIAPGLDGRIWIRTHLETRELLGLPAGRYVRLEVTDDGIGMDAATRARVFEPFFTTKRPGLGTGLGLAMVHDFVRQSGGAIDVTSTLGAGTTVSIWLPLAEDEAEDTAADANVDAATEPVPTRGLALLVEDEPQVRRVVRAQLLHLGYAVIEADNGAEALPLLEQIPDIQLLLSDVVMPGGVDGRRLARLAREAGRVQRIALMSGYAPADVSTDDDFPILAKPFTQGELARFLETLESPSP